MTMGENFLQGRLQQKLLNLEFLLVLQRTVKVPIHFGPKVGDLLEDHGMLDVTNTKFSNEVSHMKCSRPQQGL